MPRHNSCPNPAVDVDVTGWGGAATPTRVAVTGFPRAFAAHYASGSFLETPHSAVTVGVVYTISGYIQFPTFELNMNGSTYIAWYRANGSNIAYEQASFTSDLDNVTRFVRTSTAPAEAATVSIILDGTSFTSNPADVTAVLVEASSSAGDYADGYTAGWAWDGVAGLSESSELASPDQDVLPISIASGALVGQPGLTAGPVTVTPDSVASGATVGQPALVVGAVTVLPTSIAATAVVATPTVAAWRQAMPILQSPTVLFGARTQPPHLVAPWEV